MFFCGGGTNQRSRRGALIERWQPRKNTPNAWSVATRETAAGNPGNAGPAREPRHPKHCRAGQHEDGRTVKRRQHCTLYNIQRSAAAGEARLAPSPLLGQLDEVPPGAADEASSAEGPPGGKSPTRPLWHPDEGEVADPGCQVADEGSPSKTMPSG